jgi:hypothetical protein
MLKKRPTRSSFRQVKLAKERALDAIERLFRATGDDFVRNPAMKEFDQSAHEILLAIGRNTPPPPKALSSFVAALNAEVYQIRYQEHDSPAHVLDHALGAGWIADQGDSPRHWLWREGEARAIAGGWDIRMDNVRYAADALREYLEMTAICGPLHRICKLEGCRMIAVGGRGNKRFCSEEHRKAFWTYGRQRDYFRQKQKANRKDRRRTNQRPAPDAAIDSIKLKKH